MRMSTAPALHIGKLRNRFVSDVALDPVQVSQWQEAFAEQDPADLVGRVVSDEEWLLIRHLPLHLRWRPDVAASEVGHVWLQALQQAVEQAASEQDPHNVLRYRVWRHGLADLLYRSALGEVDRQWAWQRMGLIQGDGLPAAEALQQGACALLDKPDLIWPVLHHCLQAESHTGAFTALARGVPPSIWVQCLHAAPQSKGWIRVLPAARASGLVDEAPRASIGAGSYDHAAAHEAAPERFDASAIEMSEHARALLHWARRHPQQAEHLGDTLTVWLAALAWRDPGDGAVASRRLAASRQAWQQVVHAAVAAPLRQSSRGKPGTTAAVDKADELSRLTPTRIDTEPSGEPQRAPHDEPDNGLPEAPALPDPDHSVITAWAGALFFLRLLAAPDVLSTLHAQAGHKAGEPADTAALVQAVAMAMHVPADDPVMSVMTAGEPLKDIAPITQAAANRLVSQWAQWLDETLPDAPEPRVQWVCHRPGRLQIEPGWIELHLDMDQIDTRLRRIGLDLDPGWVPFIGAVVRICYD
jgi:hypothetical protein